MIDNIICIFLILVICFFLIRHLKLKKHIENFSNKEACLAKFKTYNTNDQTLIQNTLLLDKLNKDCDSSKLTAEDFDTKITACKNLENLNTLDKIKGCIDYLTDDNKNTVIKKGIEEEKIIQPSDKEELIGKIGTGKRQTTIESIKDEELKIKLLVNLLKDKREELKNTSYNKNSKNTKIEYLNNLELKLDKEIDNINKYTKKEMQENFEKIQDLKKTIEYLNHHIKLNQISDIRPKTIKSLQNGLKLSISEIDQELCNGDSFKKYINEIKTEDIYNKSPISDGNDKPIHYAKYKSNEIRKAKLKCLNENSVGKNVYLVNLNDNCLEVNGSGDYSLKPCDLTKKQQYFVLKDVYNPEIYRSHFEKASLKPPIPNNLKYPFSMVKSLNSDSCLQHFNNEISIHPCGSKKSQRWKKIEKEKYC